MDANKLLPRPTAHFREQASPSSRSGKISFRQTTDGFGAMVWPATEHGRSGCRGGTTCSLKHLPPTAAPRTLGQILGGGRRGGFCQRLRTMRGPPLKPGRGEKGGRGEGADRTADRGSSSGHGSGQARAGCRPSKPADQNTAKKNHLQEAGVSDAGRRACRAQPVLAPSCLAMCKWR